VLHVADRFAARHSHLRQRQRRVGQHPNGRCSGGLRQKTVVAGHLVELRDIDQPLAPAAARSCRRAG
jgi:hypothetical protein